MNRQLTSNLGEKLSRLIQVHFGGSSSHWFIHFFLRKFASAMHTALGEKEWLVSVILFEQTLHKTG